MPEALAARPLPGPSQGVRQLAVDSEGSAGRFHAVDGQDTADPATGGGAVDAATTSGQPSPAEKSDAWLIGRARELLALIQVSSADDQRAIVREMTALLAESQRRGDPRTTGQLLRYSAICHMLTPGQLATADSMLDELLALSRRHGLLVQMADTHALRASVTLLSGVDDAAVTEVAQALAILDDEPMPDPLVSPRTWARQLSAALDDAAQVLVQLGMYETADQVMARAQDVIKIGGSPHEIGIHLCNRVKLMLSWGLQLERIGQDRTAAQRFSTADAIADAAEGPLRESLFPRLPNLEVADQHHTIAAAHAIAAPHQRYIPRLQYLMRQRAEAGQLAMTAIALARCLDAAGDVEEAVRVLGDAREQLADDTSEPMLRLSLVREYARLSGPEGGERTTSALELYAAELEGQMWTMRASRMTTLSTRRENERLAREHGTIAKQALQDPLTGLPNRRALDIHLDTLMNLTDPHPLSVALIDLDGFKKVNDRYSHADGDEVLKVIARTLRDALRGDDIMTRYGGDEFVALLPGAPLSSAKAALGRAVSAVAALPADRAYGVTLSVGVVSLHGNESTTSVLTRADAAMYLAKRGGGNRVIAVAGDGTPVNGTPGTASTAAADGETSGEAEVDEDRAS